MYFKSGCCGSGNKVVICQAAATWTAQLQNIPLAARPNLQDSCSFSGLLKFIFCLFALEQTPMNVLLAWFPPLPSVLSFLLCSPRTQPSPLLPPLPSPVGWASSHLFSGLSSHSTNMWCPFFLPWPPFHTPWSSGAANSNCKDNKSSFPSTCSPFSSDFKPWEWHTVLLCHPLIPLCSTVFLNCRPCKPNFSYLEKNYK